MGIPKKSEIVAHWANWLGKNGFDWGEPSCWACGKFWGTKYDISFPAKHVNELFKLWDKVTPLQICHIVARQFGGSDTVDNLFLMCGECHEKSPDTKSKKLFLKWAQSQSGVANKMEIVEKEIKIFDLENRTDDILEITKNL